MAVEFTGSNAVRLIQVAIGQGARQTRGNTEGYAHLCGVLDQLDKDDRRLVANPGHVKRWRDRYLFVDGMHLKLNPGPMMRPLHPQA